MSMHRNARNRYQSLKKFGRLGLVLLAGGAFAVFAWETSPDPNGARIEADHQAGKQLQTNSSEANLDGHRSSAVRSDRQSVVTEDEALPRCERQPLHTENENQQALVQLQARSRSWLVSGGGVEGTIKQETKGCVSASHGEYRPNGLTTAPHSRSPPRG